MSEHTEERKAPGKYDCADDEFVHDTLLDGADYTGEDDYGLVSQKLILTEDDVPEHELIQMIRHYGSAFLIVIETSDGFVTVIAMQNQAEMDAEYARLDEAYQAWAEVVDR